MKCTHRSLLVLACLAVSAFACSAVRAVGEAAHSAYVTVKGYLAAFTLRGLELVAKPEAGSKGPAVVLVQAKAFVQRLAKRERPVLSPSWRMCPST